MESYRAIALQTKCFAVNRCRNKTEADEVVKRTIARLDKLISGSIAFIGFDTKLVVLPEYFLTGFPMGESIEQWRDKACLEIDGEIYGLLSGIAQKHRIFLSGNGYELDPHFPELYFQTSFVIAPNGDVVLRYRRLVSMFAPTPHDVWDKYLDIYGVEAVFPVARTEIGNLACIASEEILYPEIARCLAIRGAEIFCHSSSEVYGMENTPKNVAKLARAYENSAYVVSANSGGLADISIPENSTDGGSKIVDFKGLIIAETAQGESINAFAEIDPEALRRHRRRPGMANILARQRFELFASSYSENSFYPANTLLNKKAERGHFVETQKLTIERLSDAGII
ncbi:MAG: nitrilase [Acidobacteria bacterium]|nr:nitrilase [Acidobacteriota bacterium]